MALGTLTPLIPCDAVLATLAGVSVYSETLPALYSG